MGVGFQLYSKGEWLIHTYIYPLHTGNVSYTSAEHRLRCSYQLLHTEYILYFTRRHKNVSVMCTLCSMHMHNVVSPNKCVTYVCNSSNYTLQECTVCMHKLCCICGFESHPGQLLFNKLSWLVLLCTCLAPLIHAHTSVYLCAYCMCVCVCVREGEGEGERI